MPCKRLHFKEHFKQLSAKKILWLMILIYALYFTNLTLVRYYA